MKGTLLRVTWSALILALTLGVAGCSDTSRSSIKKDLHTMATEDTEVCETAG
ncbi:MAG: hypothetical protein RR128_03935 [Clostridium sp.]